MTAILLAVKEDGMACNTAATTFQVPEATLRRYLKKPDEVIRLYSNSHQLLSNFEYPSCLGSYARLLQYIDNFFQQLPVHGGRFRSTFSAKQLDQLQKYFTEIDKRTFGLTTIQTRKFVYDYAEQNGLPHRFNKASRMAGKEWLINFMKSAKFSPRSPEATSIGRLMGFNKVQVHKFFYLMKEVFETWIYG